MSREESIQELAEYIRACSEKNEEAKNCYGSFRANLIEDAERLNDRFYRRSVEMFGYGKEAEQARREATRIVFPKHHQRGPNGKFV